MGNVMVVLSPSIAPHYFGNGQSLSRVCWVDGVGMALDIDLYARVQ